ncbi:MAG TPA: serine/threonine protein kinase [Cyanobacteria bacterium UBA11369]|nr:serine/threonine protein kinase [Cyanobacteria bacterium UBA11371]HBE35061.1 serine/threonine protein kinase [Cyanobacteria bacterium UBA11368]HBE51880.1 serine/threonine protein kinase [Cyanobacteria bacterium UBA11369]
MTDNIVNVAGYGILNKIHQGTRTLVYRGVRDRDQKPVILKLLKNEYPTFNELVQFRNQYAITKNLEIPGIVKPLALEKYGNGYLLVMEDSGDVALSDYIANLEKNHSDNRLSIDVFLLIGIEIAKILERLYAERIIHKDIKTSNILINPETKQVKLIDFGIASLLPKEKSEIANINVLEGTLAYISPEQTGRMNRCVDYRTDFYSLGVTFYELLTGQLPFNATDAMELVHCHIAKIPQQLREINPAIPQVVSDIVMKLMSKTAESRYQSAFGLRYDLEICWQKWQEKGRIDPFILGERDVCDRFLIPEKLYGRETEVAILLNAFERVSEGSTEIMLVAGFSGIGKTAVVNEIHKPIVRQRGYFIKGKFDQFKRDIPFWAWVQAFQNLMRQLLTESATEVQKWQVKILEALGENGQVIIDVIPELEHLIGKQPEVPELEGNAAQNRFNLLFGKFIRLFATKEHPLAIFLDDLQWADSASLKLMQLLMSETDTRYLLLIGAYRDNEVFAAHPLMLTLDEIRKVGAGFTNNEVEPRDISLNPPLQNQDIDKPAPTVNQITLAPLDQPALNRLIADTLSCPLETAIPLTELVFAKTKGNPFFATQFLKSLHEDGLISFDFSYGYWQCDISQVRALALTNDVVEFMAIQLQKLPVNTQDVLKLAACIGNSFDLATLAIVYEKSQAETAADLWKALQEGLVIPSTEVYKFFQGSESIEVAQVSDLSVTYKFLHDRVQQAAYFLIHESQKQLTHLKIGQLLLSNTPKGEIEERIFDIVNQLNIGRELITHQTEKNEIAQLNLIAGRKAKASTAYAAALRYLTIGLELLDASCWQTQYELTLSLYNEAAEVAFFNGNFQQMEELADTAIKQAKTLLNKVKVYQVKIQACMALNQQLEAVNIALPLLKLLGVEFPQKPSELDVELALEETKSNLSGKRIEDLIDLPQMTEPYKLGAMKILSSVFSAAFQAIPEMFPLIVCKQVNLSLEFGNDSGSAFAYATYGLILCGIVGDIESGYQVGKLALGLLNRANAKEVKTRTMQIVYSFVIHWQEHLNQTLQPLQAAYQHGLEIGDIEYAAYCGAVYCLHAFFIGKELSSLDQEMVTYTEAIAHLKQETALNYHQLYQQFVENLLGKCVNHCQLIGDSYNEDKMLPLHLKLKDKTAIYYLYFNKSLLYYLFGEFEQAAKFIALAEQYLNGVTATLNVPLFYFYDSLVKLAVYKDSSKSEQDDILVKVTNNQEKMQKWSGYSPANYLHKFYLVAAEKHRVMGEKLEAIDCYDRAIELAQENKFINEEGLAHELAAKFYLVWGKEKIAQVYLTDAYYAYARWGAKAKVDDLEKRYPELLAPILNQTKSLHLGETITQISTGTIASTSSSVSNILDLGTVIKASQSLSGEIDLDRLLSTLMQVMIENAGASKGALIWVEGDSLSVAAQCAIATGCNLQSTPIVSSQDIPIAPINYVWRTSQTLVINNATAETTFAADPYIIQQQPKSILCLPIQHQGKAIALLYLENNLISSAFTPERLELLKVLSAQAAISLSNAQLYAQVKQSEKILAEYNRTLEQQVAKRTQELSQALQQLKNTQDELIQSEKMAALGQLVAGVAHEVNTPLGAITSSIKNIDNFWKKNLDNLTAIFLEISPQIKPYFLALLQKSSEQNQTLSTREQRQIKKALAEQLKAHQVANETAIANTLLNIGIYDNIENFLPLLYHPESQKILQIANQIANVQISTKTIITAAERAAKVVFALKTYARYDSMGEKVKANLINGIETILTLYQNQTKHGVEIIRNFDDSIPEISCYPDELNQVWTNLIHNALQAMDYKGKLTIDANQQENQIHIGITDSGKGIPPEIMPKIFQPFFTTKPAGEGSGLGLDIVRKIVEKHKGQISVQSVPGKTTFTVYLPIDR